MYIHSQNKNIIIISDNITNIYVKQSNIIISDNKSNTLRNKVNIVSDKEHYYLYCSTVSGEDIELGQYSSDKRCEEILEEILDFYVDIQQVHSVFTMPEE